MKIFLQASCLCFVILLNLGVGAGLCDTAVKTPKFKLFEQWIDFPCVPKYTGNARLLGGTDYGDGNSDGRVLSQSFLAQEDKDTILKWYADALASYGWKVPSRLPNVNQINASKSGQSCTIEASSSSQAGYSSKVRIVYRYGK
jgi:hypothetical protein